MLPYDYVIRANFYYDPHQVHAPTRDSSLYRFTRLIWHGYDERGAAVYKEDPYTGDVVRIEFLG